MDIVALLEALVNDLLKAEASFFENPKEFSELERAAKTSTESFAASFLGLVLTEMNEKIYNNGWRKEKYIAQRTDMRTLISSVGDISFDCSYFKRKTDGKYAYLLEEMIGVSRNERFTEEAEAALLCEAMKTSYAEAARVLPSKQKITKTTVMNKVHQIAEEIPYETTEELKEVPYLFIEADEDHVAEQHGKESEENKSFVSKLVYIYDLKKPVEGNENRKELVNKFYFGGLYAGAQANRKLWNNVQDYIDKTYDTDKLKRVFISGDGASWIKSSVDYLDNSLFCADKFHLMKYINRAAAQMLDEKEDAKDELWHLLYSKKPKAKERFDEYTSRMLASAKNTKSIEELRTYVLGNWAAIRRTLKNKLIDGCSAEGHVSHVLSDRLSSRPMGWSQTGADRMSKLRCYERNYGREKVIDLVKYSRKQRLLERTGTDDVPVKALTLKEILAEHYNQSRSYIDRMQATIPGFTVKKILAITQHVNEI